jgi:hypothetical protein
MIYRQNLESGRAWLKLHSQEPMADPGREQLCELLGEPVFRDRIYLRLDKRLIP